MTEQTIDATAFGRVLGELMESRGISPEREEIATLAERAGRDPRKLIARIADHKRTFPSHLNGIARELSLTEPEKTRLSLAYVFEQEERVSEAG
jgi:hypothetical protein